MLMPYQSMLRYCRSPDLQR